MKITASKYAKTLADFFEKENPRDTKAAVEIFVRVLAENGDLGLSEKIISEFSDMCDKKGGIVAGRVVTAGKIDSGLPNFIESYIRKETGAKMVRLEYATDKKILGGFIIKYGDKVYDASVRARLDKFKEHVTK